MKQIRLADVAAGLIGLAAAAASLWTVSGAGGLLGAGLALLMLAIALVDYRYFIIPDELTAAALALAIVNAAVADTPSMAASVIGGGTARRGHDGCFSSGCAGSMAGCAGAKVWA